MLSLNRYRRPRARSRITAWKYGFPSLERKERTRDEKNSKPLGWTPTLCQIAIQLLLREGVSVYTKVSDSSSPRRPSGWGMTFPLILDEACRLLV